MPSHDGTRSPWVRSVTRRKRRRLRRMHFSSNVSTNSHWARFCSHAHTGRLATEPDARARHSDRARMRCVIWRCSRSARCADRKKTRATRLGARVTARRADDDHLSSLPCCFLLVEAKSHHHQRLQARLVLLMCQRIARLRTCVSVAATLLVAMLRV